MDHPGQIRAIITASLLSDSWESVLRESPDENVFDAGIEHWSLWKKVLFVHFSDFWLMLLFVGLWEIMLWEELEVF